MLKANAPDLGQNPDMLSFVQNYTDMGFASVILFVLIGTILTMIVQASAATMAITLIMCANGWISFELGAALVLGENIGTTITANLAALTGNVPAKRAALAHLVFNVFGVIWVLCLFKPFTMAISWFVTDVMPDLVCKTDRENGMQDYSSEGTGRRISFAFHYRRFAFHFRTFHHAGSQGNQLVCRTYSSYVQHGRRFVAYNQ